MAMAKAKRLICSMEELPDDSANRFLSSGCDLVVIRIKDKLFAYRNECPHMNLPLTTRSKGILDKVQGHLVCMQHAAEFEIENGLCVNGPCQGMGLESVNIETNNGNIFLIE